MKRDEFIDAAGGINDKLLDEAIEIDSAEKLKKAENEERARRFSRIAKRISAVAACICLVTVGIIAGNRMDLVKKPPANTTENTDTVLTPSPMVYCDSKSEMEEILGFAVPDIPEKRAESYIVIMYGEKAESARIIYEDKSELKMMRGTGDISGIFGAALKASENYRGVNIYYYAFGSCGYSVWSDGGFSYCFMVSDGDSDAEIQKNTKIVIDILKGQN